MAELPTARTTFKAKPFQSAVNVPDQVRLGVVGCDGGVQ